LRTQGFSIFSSLLPHPQDKENTNYWRFLSHIYQAYNKLYLNFSPTLARRIQKSLVFGNLYPTYSIGTALAR